ncbi:Short-chain dehydrogenase/reductase SDR [Macrophomina phaseolina MS6]|uniref:Short-chain dehydrogenase/reductase SDR n=1 Tax=Macrophomina phaseolina (strain MS6) TaxID=1126212 RepID=K2S8B7_MACPH|nr:Short-chain dehydrogenase/reductase SDR [Macrophomina phaseolina MS6]
MDEQRQHLEHEKIPVSSETSHKELCDATKSIGEDGWVSSTTIDKLNKEQMERLSRFPPYPQYDIYRFKRPKRVAPSGLDIIIPLHTLGDTTPMLSDKKLIVGNMYWIKDLAMIEPDVVLLWVGYPRE